MNTLVKPLILATAAGLLLSACQQDATASQPAPARVDLRQELLQEKNGDPGEGHNH